MKPSSFEQLGLSTEILRAIQDKGYTEPSPVQAQAIPAVLTGKDVMAAAQTGTGKTAGFTLPLLHQLQQQSTAPPLAGKTRPIRALVLTPTRELAAQVEASIQTYGKYLPEFKSLVVFGGVPINPQIKVLKSGVDVLVATPGRLLDLCSQNVCKLDQVEVLILDEADRMLSMGFIPDIRRTIKRMPPKRQTLLFSATFSQEIRALTHEFLNRNPLFVEIAQEKPAAETVRQTAYRCDQADKTQLTVHLIQEGGWNQVLIFTRTKHGANRLCKKLIQAGVVADAIHGDKGQGARTRALEHFKNGQVRVLVATDIAARGLDIVQLPHVINYELPNIAEDYVHRIGRTGRAGQEGEAISLVMNDERPFLSGIEAVIGQSLAVLDVPGFEPKNWPPKPPTASEVQKAAAQRKEAARQAQGPRQKMQAPKHGAGKGPAKGQPLAAKGGNPAATKTAFAKNKPSVKSATSPGKGPALSAGRSRRGGGNHTKSAAAAKGRQPRRNPAASASS